MRQHAGKKSPALAHGSQNRSHSMQEHAISEVYWAAYQHSALQCYRLSSTQREKISVAAEFLKGATKGFDAAGTGGTSILKVR